MRTFTSAVDVQLGPNWNAQTPLPSSPPSSPSAARPPSPFTQLHSPFRRAGAVDKMDDREQVQFLVKRMGLRGGHPRNAERPWSAGARAQNALVAAVELQRREEAWKRTFERSRSRDDLVQRGRARWAQNTGRLPMVTSTRELDAEASPSSPHGTVSSPWARSPDSVRSRSPAEMQSRSPAEMQSRSPAEMQSRSPGTSPFGTPPRSGGGGGVSLAYSPAEMRYSPGWENHKRPPTPMRRSATHAAGCRVQGAGGPASPVSSSPTVGYRVQAPAPTGPLSALISPPSGHGAR